MAQGGKLFFVTALGEEGSPTRERTADVQKYVVEAAAREVGLEVERGDLDPAPGRIMEQVLDALLGARVVVCDLTGDNPNVYYELGIAHGAGVPVILLKDQAPDVPFDVKDERMIVIGDDGQLTNRKSEAAAERLLESLQHVMAPGYVPPARVKRPPEAGSAFPSAIRTAMQRAYSPLYKHSQRYWFRVTEVRDDRVDVRLELSYALVNPTETPLQYSPGLTPGRRNTVVEAKVDEQSIEVEGLTYEPRSGPSFAVMLPPEGERSIRIAADVEYRLPDANVFLTYIPAVDFEIRLSYPPDQIEFTPEPLMPERFLRESTAEGDVTLRSSGPVLAYQGLKLDWRAPG